MLIHGWNMTAGDRVSFADTAYKRLYWQGYQGTFGLFSWPTQTAPNPFADPGNYNRSEEIAWNSGAALRNPIQGKQGIRQAGGKFTAMTHSMGTVVLSEALAIAGNANILDTTILSQGAISTDFYRGTLVGRNVSAFVGQFSGPAPRFSAINQASTKVVTFYNEKNFALKTGWFLNDIQKPGGPAHGGVNPLVQTPFGGFWYKEVVGAPSTILRHGPAVGTPPVVLRIGFENYEMFAHGLYAGTAAIGASRLVGGPFAGSVDLQTLGFGDSRMDHSGQFSHSMTQMGGYWARALTEAGL
jgi:hypothetical protein